MWRGIDIVSNSWQLASWLQVHTVDDLIFGYFRLLGGALDVRAVSRLVQVEEVGLVENVLMLERDFVEDALL